MDLKVAFLQAFPTGMAELPVPVYSSRPAGGFASKSRVETSLVQRSIGPGDPLEQF